MFSGNDPLFPYSFHSYHGLGFEKQTLFPKIETLFHEPKLNLSAFASIKGKEFFWSLFWHGRRGVSAASFTVLQTSTLLWVSSSLPGIIQAEDS